MTGLSQKKRIRGTKAVGLDGGSVAGQAFCRPVTHLSRLATYMSPKKSAQRDSSNREATLRWT
jgi:hypothetical protein